MIELFRKLNTTSLKTRGFSLPRMGTELNHLFNASSGFRPRSVQDFLQSKAEVLEETKRFAPSIEERGLAAGWLRFSAMFDRLSPMLHESTAESGTLDRLWTPSTLERIDRDTLTVLKTHPRYAVLLDDEARRWWQFDATPDGTAERRLSRDEMRTLVMHTHARHVFFELHTFVQRAGRAGLTGLAHRFAPHLDALRGAHGKLLLNGFGAELNLRKALHDGDETDALLQRLRNRETLYMPLGSWGDTTYCFIEKRGYSCVLESRALAVDVTPLGTAFMHHAPSSGYREYLVAESQLVLEDEGKDFTGAAASHTAFGKDFDVLRVKRLPGTGPGH